MLKIKRFRCNLLTYPSRGITLFPAVDVQLAAHYIIEEDHNEIRSAPVILILTGVDWDKRAVIEGLSCERKVARKRTDFEWKAQVIFVKAGETSPGSRGIWTEKG